uniref:Uncharacterized protein n=1 Tax=Chrysotila carterae TaxID=13221 RepID=A0A7S4BNG2_CHRCT|mmetsp:Transcript_34215/g.75155  ORF Transcript_34215/g.75155 Transcript_34215/m.75155 type:complete len:122 (-) Transcript_34215:376-741(-)
MWHAGSPLPLVAGKKLPDATMPLEVPAAYMRERWPQLRGGWDNYYHKADMMGFSLVEAYADVKQDAMGVARPKRGPDRQQEKPIQHIYLNELAEFVRPMAQSLSWVWQDTNRPAKSDKDER